MRYCKEYLPWRASTHNLGKIRFACITAPKSWERYGIHALEGIYPILGPGFLTCRHSGSAERNIVHYRHARGAEVVVAVIKDLYGAFGALELIGTAGCAQTVCQDFYYSFRAQLEAFIDYLRTGRRPFPFSETEELMKMLIAGIESRAAGGREIQVEKAGE
jgi:hypothetical protein